MLYIAPAKPMDIGVFWVLTHLSTYRAYIFGMGSAIQIKCASFILPIKLNVTDFLNKKCAI